MLPAERSLLQWYAHAIEFFDVDSLEILLFEVRTTIWFCSVSIVTLYVDFG